ncbi:hypothetical protein [Luteimicrobium subarcticum]|uniref:Uncharacterized protein n=1 Tax=Luteimicrobium subarcticum TaxID=620910 RepID=A0A2M8WR97_9MICO|nr:hypothetical protein [Luteimicrobium subarcticum]PJI93449.1 hypothetical protein CLV34_2023 [Luteimicrobium subarcticum]
MEHRVGRTVRRSLASAQRLAEVVRPGDWVGRAVDALPVPQVPVVEPWHVSMAGIAERQVLVPGAVARRLHAFDRFGAVEIGPDTVGFDGEVLDWSRVTRVRTQVGWVTASATALDRSLDAAATTLPRVPGRRWLLERIGEVGVSLFAAAASQDVDDLLAAARIVSDDPAALDTLLRARRVVAAIEYRGTRGARTLVASPSAALLQLSLPTATTAILDTAGRHGVPVLHEPLDEHQAGVLLARGLRWRAAAESVWAASGDEGSTSP